MNYNNYSSSLARYVGRATYQYHTWTPLSKLSTPCPTNHHHPPTITILTITNLRSVNAALPVLAWLENSPLCGEFDNWLSKARPGKRKCIES